MLSIRLRKISIKFGFASDNTVALVRNEYTWLCDRTRSFEKKSSDFAVDVLIKRNLQRKHENIKKKSIDHSIIRKVGKVLHSDFAVTAYWLTKKKVFFGYSDSFAKKRLLRKTQIKISADFFFAWNWSMWKSSKIIQCEKHRRSL